MVLAVNPVLETAGQISAIIICLFIFIFILVTLVFNLAMAFGMGWVRDKVDLIKMLRPAVESANKTTETAIEGAPPSEDGQTIVQTLAQVPARLQSVDKKVEHTSDRVASAAIEFRARTIQAKTMVRAFLFPVRVQRKPASTIDEQGLQFTSPGYRALVAKEYAEMPVAATKDERPAETVQRTIVQQVKNAATR